jgi:hypothetical protein
MAVNTLQGNFMPFMAKTHGAFASRLSSRLLLLSVAFGGCRASASTPSSFAAMRLSSTSVVVGALARRRANKRKVDTDGLVEKFGVVSTVNGCTSFL